nr:hypothetical protein [Tanacetum cinerariifolium]
MIALVIDKEEDIAMLFGDDDFRDDDSEGVEEEEVNEEWLMARVTPPLMSVVSSPSVYEVGGPSTAATEGQYSPSQHLDSVTAESVYLSAAHLPVKSAPAELIQQSPHPFRSQSADPTSPEHYCSNLIMGEPLSPDRVFDFPVDEPEPHPAYDFFAPEPLPGYIAELIVKIEEQMIALVIDEEEDIAMLFGDDDFRDDDSEGVKEEEEVHPQLLLRDSIPLPSTWTSYTSISDQGLKYPLRRPGVWTRTACKKGDPVSDVEVATGISIREIGMRVFAIEGQVQVQTLQAYVQQRDTQIQQLQTIVSEMSSRESTLMQCILGMDRRLADLERRPSGPQ